MKPWYRNSTLQMDDPEMEWLQSKDPAACAVWEWLKADCMKRDTDQQRKLSPQDLEMVCRKLGVSLPTFSQVSQNLQQLGWIVNGCLKGWKKWNDRNRSPEEDALRKQVEYWKQKAELKEVAEANKKSPHFLPKPPNSPQLEETRGEETIVQHTHSLSAAESLRGKLTTAFNRKESDRWSYEEERLLCEVVKRECHALELVEILNHKKARGKYFPQSISRLLEGWTSALDSARNGHSGVNADTFKEFGTAEQSEARNKSEAEEIAKLSKHQRRPS